MPEHRSRACASAIDVGRASTRLPTCRDESRVGCADGDEGLADGADFDGTFLLGGRPGWGLRRFPGPRDDRSFVSAESRPGSGQGSQPGPDGVALTRSPGFWPLMGYAALFGVVLAFASLAFLGLVKGGTNLWFTLPKNPGWLDGSLWWVAVTAAAGVLVGVLRRVFRLPVKLPGTVEELKDQRVEPSTVLRRLPSRWCRWPAVRASGRRTHWGRWGAGWEPGSRSGKKLSEEMRATNTLTGMSAAYGGLLSAPILATILVLELARPKAARFIGHAGRGSAGLVGRVRGVLSDRGVDVRRDLRAAVVQVRGLAAAGGRSPGPGRRGARADHGGRDRGRHAARRSSRQSDDPSLDDRRSRVRAGRRGAAADAVHRNRVSSRP